MIDCLESSSNISDPAGCRWGSGGDGMWVWDDSHGPVISFHILNTIRWIAIILRVFYCHDVAYDLKLGVCLFIHPLVKRLL